MKRAEAAPSSQTCNALLWPTWSKTNLPLRATIAAAVGPCQNLAPPGRRELSHVLAIRGEVNKWNHRERKLKAQNDLAQDRAFAASRDHRPMK